MSTFPEFDPENDIIRLNGGREIMLMLLWKARFGERFDPETLLHPGLSKLLRDLQPHEHAEYTKGSPFTSEELHRIGTEIYCASYKSGWWAMTAEDRSNYVQDTVAPWVLPSKDVDAVIDSVETLRFRNGQILDAARLAEIG